jgi:hypothetical protein
MFKYKPEEDLTEFPPDPTSMCLVMFKSPGGKQIRKEMLQRVPDPGELVYMLDQKYKVTNVATMLGKPHMKVSGYNVSATVYLVFVKNYIDGIG